METENFEHHQHRMPLNVYLTIYNAAKYAMPKMQNVKFLSMAGKETFLMDAKPLLVVKLHSNRAPFSRSCLLHIQGMCECVFACLFVPYSLGFSFSLALLLA